MADVTIGDIRTSAPADALDGTELLEIEQGGVSKGATIEQSREYVASQPNVFSVTQTIEDAAPALRFSENDTTDQNWEFIGVAGALRLDELNDAFATTGTHVTYTHGGGTQFGAPTGGDQGAGTVNAEGLFENGESALVENTSGVVIQQAFASTGAVVSTTTAIPFDDTIPQDTEGAEALSISFTPKRSDSRIRISASLQLTVSVVNKVKTAAIFVSSQSGAIAVAANISDSAGGTPGTSDVPVVVDVASSDTTTRTLSVRFGANDTNTIYLNANSGGTRLYGGVHASTLEIVEYMP